MRSFLLFATIFALHSFCHADDLGVDFDAYCKRHHYQGASNTGNSGYGWSCRPNNGYIYVPTVCAEQYGAGFQAILISTPPGRPNDWRCRGTLKPITCACKTKASPLTGCLLKTAPYIDTHTWVEHPKNSEANPSSPPVLQNYCYRHRADDSGLCCENDPASFSGTR